MNIYDTMNLDQRIEFQLKEAKERYRRQRRVEPYVVSCYYAKVKWDELKERYERFCHYMRETRHNWTVIEAANYADGSSEETQVSSLTGEVRTVMTHAPHGDICF